MTTCLSEPRSFMRTSAAPVLPENLLEAARIVASALARILDKPLDFNRETRLYPHRKEAVSK